MRFARDFGTVRELLPDGIRHLWDAPWKLHDAIYHALVIIGWQENLPDDEMPPENIWLDNSALRDWFKSVKAQRDLDADPKRQIEDPVQNDAARSLIVD